MGFFNNTSSGEMQSAEVNDLQKALQAGYGTDSSQYKGGRALIPENLETEVINVVDELKDDCKVMNSIKKTPVRSTVHEVNLRNDTGEYRFSTVAEGGQSSDTNQNLERKAFNMKYIQTRRSVTKQMEAAETYEGALASEKLAGVETVIKAAEYQCFHGNSDVIPTEFDSFESYIRKADEKDRNIISLDGKSLSSRGEGLFDEVAQMVFEKGGDVSKTLFPPMLAKEIKDIFKDRIRFTPQDSMGSMQALPDYPSAIGSNIRFTGAGAGADKFYHVKGAVFAAGDAIKRPKKPATVTSAVASDAKSKFKGDHAGGDYLYEVHAVNQYGISEGTAIAHAQTVADGEKVTLTITAGEGVLPTGYIICRSSKGGEACMEMTSIPCKGQSTEFVDFNEDLPGTASMLFLTEKRLQPIYTFAQLLPACTFPLAAVNTAEIPFLVMMFGSLELRSAKMCALVKDISYHGGLY